MEKAPDAFRTISEVADDLDIPQHVLRFWETRFAQIKPMKRSGGRRYYRPDDVDLLKGIRHLLYGEGYTIRGVQRILKEHGLRSVQGLAADGAMPDIARPVHDDGDADDLGAEATIVPDDAVPAAALYQPVIPVHAPPIPVANPAPMLALSHTARDRLQSALQDLLGCRQRLDDAMKRA